MSSDYLTCRQIVELVTEYFEDALAPEERGRLEQMRQTIRLLGSIPEETVPPEAEEALLAAFRGWKRD
jgi:hypothetical protein